MQLYIWSKYSLKISFCNIWRNILKFSFDFVNLSLSSFFMVNLSKVSDFLTFSNNHILFFHFLYCFSYFLLFSLCSDIYFYLFTDYSGLSCHFSWCSLGLIQDLTSSLLSIFMLQIFLQAHGRSNPRYFSCVSFFSFISIYLQITGRISCFT